MSENDTQDRKDSSVLQRLHPGRLYTIQKPMMRVVLATLPAIAGSVYFFGWRVLAVLSVAIVLGTATEWAFCRRRGEKVSSAVLVSAILLALTLPPTVPFSVVAVGIIVAILFGKEVFGGFGRNVYNPALVGRAFIYVCFPVAMTGRWVESFAGLPGGLARWAPGADAVTRATPLAIIKTGGDPPGLWRLAVGNVGGSLGETSAILILVGGIYLMLTKTASWKVILACVTGGVAFSALFGWIIGSDPAAGPLVTVLSGGFLFGSLFMATDPISAPKTDPGKYIYGIGIGGLTVIIRAFSNFPGGIMFAILLMNTFAPITDHYVREYQKSSKGIGASGDGGREDEK